MLSEKITNGINGEISIPGDKSISHRSIIIPSISNGICEIKNILRSEDVLHTLKAFKKMGVKIEDSGNNLIIYGNGLKSLKKPESEIYLGNSGTSARLLTGLLSSQNFETILTGDKSLSSRPMKRISEPLKKMGADIQTQDGKMPIKIRGNALTKTNIDVELPSAQIKSGLILAAINTDGETNIFEKNITRDHTEIMLESFGANIINLRKNDGKLIKVEGNKELKSQNIDVPSDLSSSAFFIVSALINKNSKILLKNINVNPTRDGVLTALKLMGARISLKNKRYSNNELVYDIEAESSELNGCELDPNIAKLMIDEYPILSIAASFAKSPSIFRGLSELRVKESDRLALININLNKCGVGCKINGDNLYIDPLNGTKQSTDQIITEFDHRIAMSFAVMGSKLGNVFIKDPESIKTSFPSFIKSFNDSGGSIT